MSNSIFYLLFLLYNKLVQLMRYRSDVTGKWAPGPCTCFFPSLPVSHQRTLFYYMGLWNMISLFGVQKTNSHNSGPLQFTVYKSSGKNKCVWTPSATGSFTWKLSSPPHLVKDDSSDNLNHISMVISSLLCDTHLVSYLAFIMHSMLGCSPASQKFRVTQAEGK